VGFRPVLPVKDETSFEADNSGDQPGELGLSVPMLVGSSSDRVFIRKTGKRVEMQRRTTVPTLQDRAARDLGKPPQTIDQGVRVGIDSYASATDGPTTASENPNVDRK
jgi:hypothetical protein